MRKCLKKICVVAITLAVLWFPTTILAQETLLRWKNGDTLTGKLINSKSGKIRWKSSHFTDDLNVNMSVLDSIVFSKPPENITETFRIATVSGDSWTADIIGSDDNTLLFTSKSFGTFRVNRSSIYSLENREHSNLVFDGSQLSYWEFDGNRKNNKQVQSTKNKQQIGWYADQGGQARTDIAKTNLYYPLNWPAQFVIDLEFESTTRPPEFVFALGKNLYEALRIETWVNELVVVQGTLFEPIMSIEPDRRNFRLRLVYDKQTSGLKIFELNGNLLLKLDTVSPTTAISGPYIYNRGQDLTVKRLKVYKQAGEFNDQKIDFAKPRVNMMNGDVHHGKLFVQNGNSYVLANDGTRTDIKLQQIDQLVQPERKLAPIDQGMTLTYLDGSVIKGQVLQIEQDSVVVQTSFTEEALTCSLAGLSLLKLDSKKQTRVQLKDYDQLFFPTGSLRGHVVFDTNDKSSVKWQPIGMSEPVNIAKSESVRIQRNSKQISRLRPFSVKMFPHLMHLKNGEVIPCQVISYDETNIHFRSPFISTTRMDSTHIKGIEFTRGSTQTRKENRNPITITGGNKNRIILEDGRILEATVRRPKDGTVEITITSGNHTGVKTSIAVDGTVETTITFENSNEKPKTIVVSGNFASNDALALKRAVELMVDPLETRTENLDEKIVRALTVPRFNRDDPPSHILVANNGDIKRGKLLSFNGETILFDSRLKKIRIPIERVARIIDVSVENFEALAIGEDSTGINQTQLTDTDKPQTEKNSPVVRFALIHNPILIFEPIEVKGENLFGRSPIYGEVSIPTKSIQYLHFGERAKSFRSVYEKWVAQPAKEPEYGEDR